MNGSFFYIGNRALKNNIILWQEDKVYIALLSKEAYTHLQPSLRSINILKPYFIKSKELTGKHIFSNIDYTDYYMDTIHFKNLPNCEVYAIVAYNKEYNIPIFYYHNNGDFIIRCDSITFNSTFSFDNLRIFI